MVSGEQTRAVVSTVPSVSGTVGDGRKLDQQFV